MATWPSGLGKGLQSPVPGFDSQRRLSFVVRIVPYSSLYAGYASVVPFA